MDGHGKHGKHGQNLFRERALRARFRASDASAFSVLSVAINNGDKPS